MIPYGKHSIVDEDIEAVAKVLKNEFLTQGEQVPLFENNLREYTHAKYAIAVNSGTSALHLACIAAGVQHGDIVWTSPNSFAASANCARYCGAQVDFVDIDPYTRNLCLVALAKKLHAAEREGSLPKAIVVVHFAGSSCDMRVVAELAKPYGIIIIEDAAHGMGGKDQEGKPIGQCVYSDMAVMSFHPVKSLTTAEGGAILTNSAELASSLKLHASHGITREKHYLAEDEHNQPWFYSQQALGFNYRLSDLHAALGNSQIKRLDGFIEARQNKALTYQEALANLPVKRPLFDSNSAWHLYVIELVHHDRQTIFNQLRAKGIGVNVHYIPIYSHKYYRELGFSAADYPNCENYYKKAITLPLFPELTADMQETVIQTLIEVLV